jgi:transcriptional regulator with XRE-family HTH domain
VIELIKKLREVMDEKEISAETSALFIGVTGQEVRRWLKGEFTPTLESRKKIRRGMRRIKNL